MIPHSWLPKQAQALCEVERSYLLSEPFETSFSLSVHSHFGGAGFGSVSISPFPFMPTSRSHYARTLFGTSPRGGGTVLLLTCHRSREGPRSFATHITISQPLCHSINCRITVLEYSSRFEQISPIFPKVLFSLLSFKTHFI